MGTLELDADTEASVTGELYKSAQSQMQYTQAAIKNQIGIGFASEEECAKWAAEHHLDLLCLSPGSHAYYYLTERGELLLKTHWAEAYSRDLLFIRTTDKKGREHDVPWVPNGTYRHSIAKIPGELSDGKRQPLHHRNYFTPTGYFEPTTGTFNTAVPFPAFAKATGRDTSHIHTLLKHIAGEKCYPYLLAWLRYKMINPNSRTEIVPVFASRVEGNGKSSFVNSVCTALFGRENIDATGLFNTNNRFNSDTSDKLIVSIDEKNENDSKIDLAALKALTTAPYIRKENKGVDPIQQLNYTEYIITTNKDVPIKFDNTEEHRRFMIMDTDPNFTRKNPLADQVFTKLYGLTGAREKVGLSFAEDKDLISQFKHELLNNKEIAALDMHDFPKDTDAYKSSQSIPRTTESTEIESIVRSLAPFIKASLDARRVVTQVCTPAGEQLELANYISTPHALQYIRAGAGFPAQIAVCRPLVFYDQQSGKPFAHAVVERSILDCKPFLVMEGLKVLPNQMPLPGGFMNVATRHRNAPAARFTYADPEEDGAIAAPVVSESEPGVHRINRPEGSRIRVNSFFKPDKEGEFETVNEMKTGIVSIHGRKSDNVAYMDTFLFEADDVSKSIYALEKTRLEQAKTNLQYIQAEALYMERLRLQRFEADRLLQEGKACRVVYSGAKSYHILVRVKDTPKTLDEYKWLHAHLCTSNVLSDKLEFDGTCCDPGRLTRSPITKPRETKVDGVLVIGTQKLYKEMPDNVFDYDWRLLYEQWLNRPLTPFESSFGGKKMRPMKKEYKEAAEALGRGTFWTDPEWNGRRQVCFFPAYRILRLAGFTREQLWCYSGLFDGLDKYYKREDIQYWYNREKCDLVRAIDEDCDAILAEESENAP